MEPIEVVRAPGATAPHRGRWLLLLILAAVVFCLSSCSREGGLEGHALAVIGAVMVATVGTVLLAGVCCLVMSGREEGGCVSPSDIAEPPPVRRNRVEEANWEGFKTPSVPVWNVGPLESLSERPTEILGQPFVPLKDLIPVPDRRVHLKEALDVLRAVKGSLCEEDLRDAVRYAAGCLERHLKTEGAL